MSGVDHISATDETLAARGLAPEIGVAGREAALCARQLTNLWAAEYPGPAGAELWTHIGLDPDEAAEVECDPATPVAEHYWRYRRELEGRGDTRTLGLVHQHIDGIYVFLASGLTDRSGFQDVSARKIDRDGRKHSAERLTWLTIAGLYSYGLGPSARAHVEADTRGRVMGSMHDMATALRTAEFRAPSNAAHATDTTVHACLLDLLAGASTDPRYFTAADVDRFIGSYSIEAVRSDRSWGELWDHEIAVRGDVGAAEVEYADAIFQGIAITEYATALRAEVELESATWVRHDGSLDYDRVQRSLDDIVADIQAGREHVGSLLPIDRPALDGAVIVDDGIRLAATDPTSPYSCVPSAVTP